MSTNDDTNTGTKDKSPAYHAYHHNEIGLTVSDEAGVLAKAREFLREAGAFGAVIKIECRNMSLTSRDAGGREWVLRYVSQDKVRLIEQAINLMLKAISSPQPAPSTDDEIETWQDADLYGIYATEDFPGAPLALFRDLFYAQNWLKQMQDADELGCDYCIIKTTASGTYRNHGDTVEASDRRSPTRRTFKTYATSPRRADCGDAGG